jgi:NAD(P)-dependent dehydrogenase (short-subunit alcohol dehydrogenase family)
MGSSKVIILTGASRGIGLAVAEYLLKASQRLVLVARSAEPLEILKKHYPGQVEVLAADLSDFSVRSFSLQWMMRQCTAFGCQILPSARLFILQKKFMDLFYHCSNSNSNSKILHVVDLHYIVASRPHVVFLVPGGALYI